MSSMLCNTFMFTYLARALALLPSAVDAKVASTSMNFALTALFDFLVFGHVPSVKWTVGVVLVLAGCLLIMRQTLHKSSEPLDAFDRRRRKTE